MTRLISYAQNFEDVILWRALGSVREGRYIDIGAQSPRQDSVSRVFHEQGWRGIHVEPSPTYAAELRKERPGDVVLQCAITAEPGVVRFFDIAGTGLSTLEQSVAQRHFNAGMVVEETTVVAITLDDVLAQAGDSGIVHWLKIDVEGAELAVVRGWRTSPVRPWVIVLESTTPLSTAPSYSAWEPLLIAKGYRFAYFDGINRFYVSEGHLDLLPAFNSGPNIFDNFSLSSSSGFCEAVNLAYHALETSSQAREAELQLQQAQFESDRAQWSRERDYLQHELQGAARVQAEQAAAIASTQFQMEQLVNKASQLTESLSAANMRVETLDEEISRARKELGKRAGEIERMKSALHLMRGDLKAADHRIEELAHQAHRWWVEAESLRTQLDQMIQSNSWRLTAPIRWVRRRAGELGRGFLRGIKQGARPFVIWGIRNVSQHERLYHWLKPKLARVPSINRRLVQLAEREQILTHVVPPPSLTAEVPDGVAPIYLDLRARMVLAEVKAAVQKECVR